MKPLRIAVLPALALLLVGTLVGIYIQHRWPVGLWGRGTAPAPVPTSITPQSFASIPPARRLVLLVVGQSNAANYGSVRADAGPGVYAWDNGNLVQARDPLPGADRDLGSIWTRLGPALMLSGKFDAILFASIAEGSSGAADWDPQGRLHDRLQSTLRQLTDAGIPPNFILWQQGESEGISPHASGGDYVASMTALIRSSDKTAPGARWLIARATHYAGVIGNAQIREAQRLASHIPGASAGPDLDTLTIGYRSDGVHFNGAGLEAAAALWARSLSPFIDSPAAP